MSKTFISVVIIFIMLSFDISHSPEISSRENQNSIIIKQSVQLNRNQELFLLLGVFQEHCCANTLEVAIVDFSEISQSRLLIIQKSLSG